MRLKHNIVATYAGQIYGAIIGLAMLPVFLRYLGAEAYGLIAFFAMLQGLLQLLDIGLIPTMGREAARFRGGATAGGELRALLRFLEIVFAAISGAAGLLLFLSADFIAGNWLKPEHLAGKDIRTVIQLMVVTLLLRLFGDLYRGAIAGFERLVWLAAVGATFATARFVLVVALLAWVSTDVVDFFIFQLVIGVLEILVIAAKAYRLLPSSSIRANWRWRPAKGVLGLSVTMGLGSIAWVCGAQTDKLLLSALLPLTSYGWFNLAAAAASGVSLLTVPIFTALAPRMTALHAQGQEKALLTLYRSATQWVSALVWPASAVLAVQAERVLWIWTGDSQAASQAADTLRPYAIGNAVLAVASLPYHLQFAKGRLRLNVAGTVLMVMALMLGLLWAAPRFGSVGAGWVWLVVISSFLMFWVPLAHARYAPGLHARWLLHDVAPIALLSGLAALASQWLPWSAHRGLAALELLCVAAIALIAGTAGSSHLRDAVRSRVQVAKALYP